MILKGVITLIIDNKEEHDIVMVDWEKGKACGEYLPCIVTTPTQPQHNFNITQFKDLLKFALVETLYYVIDVVIDVLLKFS